MTGKYAELLSIATSQRKSRNAFEARAVDKVTELGNELAAFLLAPKDRIVWLKLEPGKGESAAPGGAVITSSGLKFGLQILVDVIYARFVSTISPSGDRLLVHITDNETLDVTDREGVLRWCEFMEAHVREVLAGSIDGVLSAKLSAPK